MRCFICEFIFRHTFIYINKISVKANRIFIAHKRDIPAFKLYIKTAIKIHLKSVYIMTRNVFIMLCKQNIPKQTVEESNYFIIVFYRAFSEASEAKVKYIYLSWSYNKSVLCLQTFPILLTKIKNTAAILKARISVSLHYTIAVKVMLTCSFYQTSLFMDSVMSFSCNWPQGCGVKVQLISPPHHFDTMF
jgi:hypothetical protein